MLPRSASSERPYALLWRRRRAPSGNDVPAAPTILQHPEEQEQQLPVFLVLRTFSKSGRDDVCNQAALWKGRIGKDEWVYPPTPDSVERLSWYSMKGLFTL